MANYYLDTDVIGGLGDGSSWANAFASLSAAISGLSLTEDSTLYCSGATADTSAVVISGVTNGYKLTIQAAEGDEALKTGWDTSRYHMSVSSGNSAITCNEDYVEIIGLQIEAYDANSQSFYTISAVTTLINACRFKGDSNSGNRSIVVNASAADVTVTNCIIENASDGLICWNGNLEIYNTIVYASYYDGIEYDSGTGIVKNCAVFSTNTTDFDIDPGATVTLDYNASDDGDGTNSISPSGSDWTNEFADPANGDFTLLNTGNLFEAGVGPSTDSNVPTTDIDGTTRSGTTCSIGADEYETSGSTLLPICLNVTVAGQNPNVSLGKFMVSTLGTISASGLNPAVSLGKTLNCTLGTITATGLNATVTASSPSTDIDCSLGSVTVQGFNPNVSRGLTFTANTGQVTVTGHQATVSNEDTIICSTGTVTVTGHNPSVSKTHAISCQRGAVTVSGLNPSVTNGNEIVCGLGSILVAGHQAEIAHTLLIESTTGVVTVLGFNPSVQTGELPETPTERICSIALENRVHAVESENRVYSIT